MYCAGCSNLASSMLEQHETATKQALVVKRETNVFPVHAGHDVAGMPAADRFPTTYTAPD